MHLAAVCDYRGLETFPKWGEMISGSISWVGWWEWSSLAHNGIDCLREVKNNQETHHRSGPLFYFSPCASIPNITSDKILLLG